MEVYLNIYDYSSWNRTLEKCGMGLYHTGVEIKYKLPNSVISNIAIA